MKYKIMGALRDSKKVVVQLRSGAFGIVKTYDEQKDKAMVAPADINHNEVPGLSLMTIKPENLKLV
jgi:hypothetical protein